MRILSFLFFSLFPASAFACMWGDRIVTSAPLDYLVTANVFAAIAAMLYIGKEHRSKSLLPEALIGASVVASVGLAVLSEGAHWHEYRGVASLVFLSIPYLAMKYGKLRTIPLLIAVATVALYATLQIPTERLHGFGVEPEIPTEVTF